MQHIEEVFYACISSGDTKDKALRYVCALSLLARQCCLYFTDCYQATQKSLALQVSRNLCQMVVIAVFCIQLVRLNLFWDVYVQLVLLI